MESFIARLIGNFLVSGLFAKKGKGCIVALIMIFGVPILIYLIALIGRLLLPLVIHDSTSRQKIQAIVTIIILFSLICWGIFTVVKKLRKKKLKIVEPGTIGNEQQNNPYTLTLKTSQGHDLNINNPFRGILCIGGAGSGKSESILRQLMKSAVEKDYCGIIYDFKYPILTNELEGFLRNKPNGKVTRHYNINFFDVSRSSRVNPLASKYIPNASFAREYAISIINNLLPESIEKKDFWIRSSTDLLTAAIYYLAKEHPLCSSLPHVVALILSDEKKLISLLSKNIECLGMVRSLEGAIRNNSNEQLTGVTSTLQSAISVLNTPEIFYILSGNDFSLDVNNLESPFWLSLGNNPTIYETYSPIISLIITVALKQMNQKDRHHSAVFLDEAPTIFLPKLEVIPATARSNKVSIAYFAQDMSQIIAQYGQHKADIVLGLLNNQFFGRVSHQKSAEYISKLFGKEDRYFEHYSNSTGESSSFGTSFSSGSNTGHSKTYVIQEREKIKIQDVLNLSIGEFCVHTVESGLNDYKVKFKNIPCMPEVIKGKSLFIDIDTNFGSIYKDIEQLFSSVN